MKIQIESIDELEGIFKGLIETEDGKHAEDELEVLLQVKDLFLKNAEVGGKELDLGKVTQEGVNRKKTQAKLISKIEEAETQKLCQLKELCALRKELPLLLQQEVADNYRSIIDSFAQPVAAEPPRPIAPAAVNEARAIGATVRDLSEKLPVLAAQIREKILRTEHEIKERIRKKGKQLEIEALSLLFKDELELVPEHK